MSTVNEVNDKVLKSAARGYLDNYEWPEDGFNVPRCPNPALDHQQAIMDKSFDEERLIRNELDNGRSNEVKYNIMFENQKKRIAEAIALENDITRLPFFPTFLAISRVFPHFRKDVCHVFDFKNCSR